MTSKAGAPDYEPLLHVTPEPWDYNPSAWSQRIPICLFASVATVLAVYMALYQWRLIDSVWDPFFGAGSMQVLDSDVSHTMRKWMLIPDAALGALAYLGDIIFALAGSTRRWQYRPWLVLLFGLDVIPLGIVSAILVVLQGVVVGYWCTACLVTAAISLLLVYFAYDEVWSCMKYLGRAWKRSETNKERWDIFWGRPTPVGIEVGNAMIQNWKAK
ncbi:MAG: vitamin K epoxide reductase family protein [Phycisphaerales bacterium]